MIQKILIIGKGNIGLKHYKILKLINKNFNILNIASKTFIKKKEKTQIKIKKFNPDYIVIASPSSKHFENITILEKIFIDKTILIEKPLFNKNYKIKKTLNNKYFVGYNLRFNPILNFIKKFTKNKNFFFINVFCSSYLPKWRKKIKYNNSVSAKKKLGGGVLLELSHEIDYLNWIFGEIKIINCLNKKISNLKINTDDIFLFYGKIKNIHISISLNFFSRLNRREIIVDGEEFSIHGNLIENKLDLLNKKGKITRIFNKENNLLKLQHEAIINKDYSNLCSIPEAQKVLKFIEKSRQVN